MTDRGWLAVAVLLVVSYFLGRSTAPERVVTRTETVFVDKVVEVESKNQTVLERIRVKPSGESVTVRKIRTESESNRQQIRLQNESTISVKESSPTTLLFNYDTGRAFGVSASRRVLGPLTIGVFGFSDGRVGGSLGVSF
ncbi:MAG: hypothetical protein EBX40_01125 [Gammaproteobacteria bacterium]|nr:hypothetical protein [Gammaproteobacteria bacterium]